MRVRVPVLLFDWDGVIVDSNEWKWIGAWKEVFTDEPELSEVMEEILSEDVEKFLSRSCLVDEMCIRALQRGVIPEFKEGQYLDRFGEVVRKGTVRIGLFPEVRQVLSALDHAGYRMYVISMTAQQDLEYIAQQLGVEKYFIGLYGAPGSKEEHAKVINEKESPEASFVVIGDGIGDRNLADHLSCVFVGVENKWNKWRTDGTLEFSIENLKGLPAILQQMDN